MKKPLFLWIFFMSINSLFSQVDAASIQQDSLILKESTKKIPSSPEKNTEIDNLFLVNKGIVIQKDTIIPKNSKKKTLIPLDSVRNMYGGRYVDYKIITQAYDTIQIDTTLNIDNYFRHNYTQKDDFEWLEFANQGQGYNKLAYDFINNKLTPTLGVNAKLYNYYALEDMEYYHVPTPTTILFYRSGFDGQLLNSIFTTNFGKHQNFSIAYKGLRSVGDYQRARASHINFRTTYTYYNPAKRYQFRTHIISQKIDNLENGGLTESSVTEFKNDNPDFSARGRVDVNLSDSETYLKSTRFYYEHELRILNSKDSLNLNMTNLKLGHFISTEKLKYQFTSSDTEYFDDNSSIFGTRESDDTKDKTEYNTTENQIYLKFNSPYILGNFKIFTAFNSIAQVYETSKVVNETEAISKEKNINYTSFGGSWNSRFKGVFLNAYAQQIISGGDLGSNLHINAGFQLKNNVSAKAGFQLKSIAPNNNTTFYQSNFSNLNWEQNFDNEIYRTLYGSIKTKWLGADLFLHQIKNYAYFNSNSVASQYSQTIDYLKLKLSSELKFGKFAFNNSILYQKTTQGEEAFRVPEFVTRNTLYYQSYFFKGDPLLAQIGLTFKYFSKYYANDYNPALNEFYIQNNTQIGDYPTFDVFVNGEVRRTRIYFKVENVTAAITGRNYFATSNQPAKDLSIRLGIVWNFWN